MLIRRRPAVLLSAALAALPGTGNPAEPAARQSGRDCAFRTTTANILTTLSRAYDELRNRRGTRGLEHGGEL